MMAKMNAKRQVIFKKTGGRCYYCGKILSEKWHIDHMNPVDRNPKTGKMHKPENDNFENKVPSCPRCNNWKRSFSINRFRLSIQTLITGLNRDSAQYRMAKDYGLIKETGKVVQFFYETKKPLYSSILDEYEKVILRKAINFCIELETMHSKRKALENIKRKLQL